VCNVEQDPKIAHGIDRNSQKRKCATESRREGGREHLGLSHQFMSVCGMVHPAQQSNDPVPQLGPLQPQEEFIQVDLPQAQGFCE